jgi:mono/diheme cytochrome c family protein/uncharacterized membrane protein
MKKCWLFAVLSIALFAGTRPAAARAGSASPSADIGNRVRGVFAAKCAGCHGPDLEKPRGRFGYVLDLKRVAANPEIVIPSQPDESEMWELVRRGEMPPADSPHGALAPEQKEIIRAWIAAGAPDALPLVADSVSVVRSQPSAPATVESAPIDRLIRWLGKFHLLLLHFPIALVLTAGAAELWSIRQRESRPSEVVRFCLWLGVLAAIPTATLGWIFAAAGNGADSPQLLLAHRLLGTTAALWFGITAVTAERDVRRQQRSMRFRLLLMAGILITAITAHLGGLLVHGEEFFTF